MSDLVVHVQQLGTQSSNALNFVDILLGALQQPLKGFFEVLVLKWSDGLGQNIDICNPVSIADTSGAALDILREPVPVARIGMVEDLARCSCPFAPEGFLVLWPSDFPVDDLTHG